MKDFQATKEGTSECYRVRVDIPHSYHKQPLIANVYWNNEIYGWCWSIGSDYKTGYTTREDATKGILDAIGEMITTLQGITTADFIPEIVETIHKIKHSH